VDVAEARAVLGVGPDAVWPDVRASYLRLVREHHPDTAQDDADAGRRTVRTAQITAAYSVLFAQRPATSTPRPSFTPKVEQETLADAMDGSRRVLLAAGMDDAFVALLEVAHLVGVVSYVDRQSAVLETIVTAEPGQATSLLIFLEPGEEEGVTEAFLGVESLGGHPPAPLDPLVDRIAELLATERPPVPEP
jgi:DnaJ domain